MKLSMEYFHLQKNALKKAKQRREESASNNNSRKSTQFVNKGQKNVTTNDEEKESFAVGFKSYNR